MDFLIKKANLLILKGVHWQDFNACETRVEKEPEKKTTQVYDTLPKRFTGLADWPSSTNLLCWNCDQFFVGRPKFVPLNVEKIAEKEVCDSIGNFCRWSCVVSFILDTMTKDQCLNLMPAVRLFEQKFTGKEKKMVIKRALPKTLMCQYCGPDGLTPKEWNEKNERLSEDYEIGKYRLSDFSVENAELL